MELWKFVIDIAGALGTMLAAVFAGCAAFAAARIVNLEKKRDVERREATQLRQARLIITDAVTTPLYSVTNEEAKNTTHPHEFPKVGVDVVATVVNAGPEPIRDVMAKIVVGAAVCGPQRLGPMRPQANFWVAARMFSGADEQTVDVYCRFKDTQGQAWEVHNHGEPRQVDDHDAREWINQARLFDVAVMSPAERGTLSYDRSYDAIDILRRTRALPVEGWVHKHLVPTPGNHMTTDDSYWPPGTTQMPNQVLSPE